ncbi:hypothetical protein [Metabacillus sp. SLBN-84]
MIITAIIMFCVGILSWIIALMPSLNFSFSPENQSSFVGVIDAVSCLVPMNTIGIIMGLIILAYGIEFLWYIFNWVIAKIPFID